MSAESLQFSGTHFINTSSIVLPCAKKLGSGITTTQVSASVNPANANYLFKQLGDSPNNSRSAVVTYDGTPGYTYLNFKNLTGVF